MLFRRHLRPLRRHDVDKRIVRGVERDVGCRQFESYLLAQQRSWYDFLMDALVDWRRDEAPRPCYQRPYGHFGYSRACGKMQETGIYRKVQKL